MKKIIRKSFLLLSLFTLTKANSQSCGTPAGPPPPASPINCTQLLKDFIPTMTEPELEIYVNVYVFQPPGGGIWGAATQADADQLLYDATQRLNNNASPKLTTIPAAIDKPSAKIKLVRKSFQLVTNTIIYNDLDTVTSYPAYSDPNAINLYCGACNPSIPCVAFASAILSNNIFFPQATPNSITTKAKDFNHELGHTLGLDHPTDYVN